MMKKKLLSFILCFCMVLGLLVGCGNSNVDNTEGNNNSTNEEANNQTDEGTSEHPNGDSGEQDTEDDMVDDSQDSTDDGSEDSTEDDSEDETIDKEETEANKKEQCLNEAVNAYKNYIASHKNNQDSFYSINLVYLGDGYYPALIKYGYGSNFCTLYIYSPTLGVINVNQPNDSRLINGSTVYYNDKTKIFRLSENESPEGTVMYGRVTDDCLEICCVIERNDAIIKTYDKNYFEAEVRTDVTQTELEAQMNSYGNSDDFYIIKDSFSNIDEAAEYLLTGTESFSSMINGVKSAYKSCLGNKFYDNNINSMMAFKTDDEEYPCLLALLEKEDTVSLVYCYISEKEAVGHYIADGKVLLESCNYQTVNVHENGNIVFSYTDVRGDYKVDVREFYTLDNTNLKLVAKYERTYFIRDGACVNTEYKIDNVVLSEEEALEWLDKNCPNGYVSYLSIEDALDNMVIYK